MTKLFAARCLFTINAVGFAVGGFVGDWKESYFFNARWLARTQCHGGQTIAAGVFLAFATLSFARRRVGDRKSTILAAAITGGVIYWAQSAAFAFPGIAWTNPEFPKAGQSLEDAGPQNDFELGGTLVIWRALPRKADATTSDNKNRR